MRSPVDAAAALFGPRRAVVLDVAPLDDIRGRHGGKVLHELAADPRRSDRRDRPRVLAVLEIAKRLFYRREAGQVVDSAGPAPAARAPGSCRARSSGRDAAAMAREAALAWAAAAPSTR
jgi:hypothetical protein